MRRAHAAGLPRLGETARAGAGGRRRRQPRGRGPAPRRAGRRRRRPRPRPQPPRSPAWRGSPSARHRADAATVSGRPHRRHRRVVPLPGNGRGELRSMVSPAAQPRASAAEHAASGRAADFRPNWHSARDSRAPSVRGGPVRSRDRSPFSPHRGSRSPRPARRLASAGGRFSPSRSFLRRRTTDRRHRTQAPAELLAKLAEHNIRSTSVVTENMRRSGG